MVEGLIFTPKLPQIKVIRLETREQIKDLGELLRNHKGLFLRLDHVYVRAMRTRGDMIYVPSSSLGREEDEGTLIAKVGMYVLTSENGKRFITDKEYVKHGVFAEMPWELFVPIEGEVVKQD